MEKSLAELSIGQYKALSMIHLISLTGLAALPPSSKNYARPLLLPCHQFELLFGRLDSSLAPGPSKMTARTPATAAGICGWSLDLFVAGRPSRHLLAARPSDRPRLDVRALAAPRRPDEG